MIKNDHLKKYEIKIEEIDVDIYVPFYSRLPLPIKEIKKHTTKIQNILVVKPEVLLILKQQAELDRGESVKGMKDRIDMMALLCFASVDITIYNKLLEQHKLQHFYARLKTIINTFTEIKHLNLSPREFKKKKEELLKKLRSNVY